MNRRLFAGLSLAAVAAIGLEGGAPCAFERGADSTVNALELGAGRNRRVLARK